MLLRRELLVLAGLLVGQRNVRRRDRFSLERAPRRESRRCDGSCGDGCGHRAPGLGVVPAVSEPAIDGEVVDVREGLSHRLRLDPQADAADPGGVDQHAAGGQDVHVPRRRRVPALRVARAHVTNCRDILTEQRVDQARLPGAGLPEHRDRLVARAFAQPVEADALPRRRDDHFDPGARGDDFLGRGVRVRSERRLGEHHNRGGAGVAGQRGTAVDPARLHGPVEPAHEEDDVDVRGEHLAGVTVRGSAPQERRAGKHRDGLLTLDGHPVTDRGRGVEPPDHRNDDDPPGGREVQRGPVVARHTPSL